MSSHHVVVILGIEFFQGTKDQVLALLKEGGLFVFPSGPGLACDLPEKPIYRRALTSADCAFPDSGLMALLWNIIEPSKKIIRYSGLKFIRDIFESAQTKGAGVTFWVMPSVGAKDENIPWLKKRGYTALTEEDCYVAPIYNNQADGGIEDEKLREILERRRPAYVFLSVGGGIQERLGLYLKENLSYRPAILCTGAAMAFLTGGQAKIPPWADRFYLGWFLRILSDPMRFGRRYLEAWKLVPILLKYRDKPVDVIWKGSK